MRSAHWLAPSSSAGSLSLTQAPITSPSPSTHTGYFLTRIFHPNVSTSGDICVNTLKRDWTPDLGLRHILTVIRCLLVEPNPESALNEEAGRLLLEGFPEFARKAALITSVHATRWAGAGRCQEAGGAGAGRREGCVRAAEGDLMIR